MFLLDTCVVSDLRRAAHVKGRSPWFQKLTTSDKQAFQNLVAWADGLHSTPTWISAVTAMEIEQGILSLSRQNPQAGAVLSGWFKGVVLVHFADAIVPFDLTVAMVCAALHVPNNKSYRDAMIGACAASRKLTIVTRNTQDFIAMQYPSGHPLDVFNPYL